MFILNKLTIQFTIQWIFLFLQQTWYWNFCFLFPIVSDSRTVMAILGKILHSNVLKMWAIWSVSKSPMVFHKDVQTGVVIQTMKCSFASQAIVRDRELERLYVMFASVCWTSFMCKSRRKRKISLIPRKWKLFWPYLYFYFLHCSSFNIFLTLNMCRTYWSGWWRHRRSEAFVVASQLKWMTLDLCSRKFPRGLMGSAILIFLKECLSMHLREICSLYKALTSKFMTIPFTNFQLLFLMMAKIS